MLFDFLFYREFPKVEECVVAVLEECKIKTPANIIGALFRYLRKNMDCAPKKEAIEAGDARGLDGKNEAYAVVASLTLISTLLVARML